MTPPDSLEWTAEVVHSLLNYPQRLLAHPAWSLVIAELGGLRHLHQQLLTYPLKNKELRLLTILISQPDASVEYYCDMLAIHPATFHRQQNALCQRLSGLLPPPQLPNIPQRGFQMPQTSFIGRTLDLERIQLLFDQGCDWINLIGPAGVGKTRLALEIGQRVGPSFRDGVGLLHIPTGATQATLAHDFLAQLGLDSPQLDSQQQLQNYFSSRHMLLVLDNLNQPELAAWLFELLQAAPFVRVLATGTQRLHVPQERLHYVEGLSYLVAADQPIALEEHPSLQLLGERLSNFQPIALHDSAHVEVASQLCQLVGGLPLALEVLASLSTEYDLTTVAAQLQPMASSEQRLAWLINLGYTTLQPATKQLLTTLARLPRWLNQREVADLQGLSAQQLQASLHEAQSMYLLVDWAVWYALPSCIQHSIANPECEFKQQER
ncbi:NB-ARC domain-containing protein [Herpetosiphon llansteffanensis]|uniref:NB-ARC domain-containing protein n=1 Tax=Herpetosiphon llansteffanensis TaxID=2094568 RepID=UPI000D7CC993|nr:NB-ARC domain-containing protein [Herpetosiphon llansteffanensis]